MTRGRSWGTRLIVAAILLVMAVLMLFSALGDSVVIDEITYLPAGFANLTTGIARLNPEAPPLMQDVSAAPLVIARMNFPYDLWRAGADNLGERFLFASGNDPSKMLLLARLPTMLIALVLGLLVFLWGRELYGPSAGILALLLYAFNTTVLAHARYATSDLAITFAIFLNLYCLYRFLDRPSWWRLVATGLTLGVAFVTKFTAIILLPTYLAVGLMALVRSRATQDDAGYLGGIHGPRRAKRAGTIAVALVSVVLIGVAFTWAFYLPHVLMMSPAEQRALITASYQGRPAVVLRAMSSSAFLRPLSQWTLGMLMQTAHVRGGSPAVLLDSVSNVGWWYYYPLVIAWKTQLAFFVLLGAMILAWKRLKRSDAFTEGYLWVLPAFLLVAGMAGRLQIGIRYMLPLFPLVFVSLSKLGPAFKPAEAYYSLRRRGRSGREWLAGPGVTIVVGLAVVWYVGAALLAYPHYTAYFNELVGGYANGDRYLSDSNVDWGQDVERLAAWVDANGISRIYVDVFPGPDSPRYYLGHRMIPWKPQDGRPKGYLAVSSTTYWLSVASKTATQTSDYEWLRGETPVANIGGSIRVYDLP